MSRKIPLLAALAVAGALATGAAQARDHADIQWSVTIGAPLFGAVVGAPVYPQPVPVYAPQYTPQYMSPYRPQWQVVPQTRWDRDHDGIPNRHDRVDNRWDSRWGDRDRDGIPNRYDRVFNPRWDRDGDGIPNRHDRHPGHPGR